MKQYLKLKLSQKLSPQQIQLMKLIQLPTLDFEQKIQREIEENPALEQGQNSNDDNQEENQDDYSDSDDINIDDYLNYDDTPSYKLNSNNSGRAEEKNIPFSAGSTTLLIFAKNASTCTMCNISFFVISIYT